MADGLVLDASAVLALLLGEPEGLTVREHLVRAAGRPLLTVDLFWLEVVNVLVRRHGWDPDAVVEAVRELDELAIETVAPDRPLVLAALDLAAAHGITVYDASYLALADAADAGLLTLDERLARVAGTRAVVRPGPSGVHEAPAPYASAPVPHWTRHGRYLADLRRAAEAS